MAQTPGASCSVNLHICPKCGTDFELMRRISEMNEPASCPQCGAEAERLVSGFASKVGFYIRAPAKPLRKPSK